jgi:hypothetical protein
MSEQQFDQRVSEPVVPPLADDSAGFDEVGFDAAGFCDWLRTLSLDALCTVADEHAALVRAAHARQLLVLGVLGERSVDRVDGALDLAAWITQRDAVRPGTARQAASIAARLSQLPAIASVAASGALSVDQLAPLVRLADADTDAAWAERAPGWTPAALEQAARRRERVGSTEAHAAFQRREVRFWTDRPTGDGRFSGRMPADRVALVRSIVEQAAHEARPTTDQPHERWEARCCDALADLVLAGGAAAVDQRPVVPQVIAHIDARALHPPQASPPGRRDRSGPGRSRRSARPRVDRAPLPSHPVDGDPGAAEVGHDGAACCEQPWAHHVAPPGPDDAPDPPPSALWAQLVDGTPISVETARRLSCDASIQTWLVDRFTPMAAGRARRTPTVAQHAALRLRSQCCEWPGCRRRRGLYAHHLRYWSRRGPTDLDNLVLLCWAHHRLVHNGGFGLRGDPTRPGGLEVVRPDRRPLASVPASIPSELAAALDAHAGGGP